MCRLLAIIGREAGPFRRCLYEAPRSLRALAREHRDGWGIAVDHPSSIWLRMTTMSYESVLTRGERRELRDTGFRVPPSDFDDDGREPDGPSEHCWTRAASRTKG
jgi:hypothetical protein